MPNQSSGQQPPATQTHPSAAGSVLFAGIAVVFVGLVVVGLTQMWNGMYMLTITLFTIASFVTLAVGLWIIGSNTHRTARAAERQARAQEETNKLLRRELDLEPEPQPSSPA